MQFHFADCILDEAGHALWRDDREVAVEPLVFDLLLALVRQSGELVTRDQIVDLVWQGRFVSDSAISAAIAAARKAVGDDGKRQEIIRTVPRRGLMLVADVRQQDPASRDTSKPPADPAPTVRFTQAPTGQPLAYAVSGSGPPVVRIYPGSHLELEWRGRRDAALFDVIMQSNTLMRVDTVGVGLSGPLSGIPDFFDVAEQIRTAIEAAGFDKVILYSESGGVHASLRFAAKHPDRVRKLVIVGGYVEGRALRRDEPDFLRGMIQEGWTEEDTGFAQAFTFSYYPDGPAEEVMEFSRTARVALSQASVLPYRDAINTVSNAEILGQIQCPVLVVHARKDAIHPLEQAQRLAAGIPNAELLVLEGANHLPFPGHATWEQFRTGLRAFLDRAE